MGDLRVDCKQYGGDFPFFRQPIKFGEFSLDDARHYQPDCSQRKFVCWPSKKSLQNGERTNVKFDLNFLMDQVVRKDDSHVEERLENLLQWISRNWARFKVAGKEGCLKSLSTDFVCYRGLLTRLMATPYETREPWIICATRWRGTVYLCAFDTEQKIRERQRETDRQRTMASWGFKFEQYMMSDSPEAEPDPGVPVAETAEFCCVLRGRLGQHSLVYGAEVDGIDPLYKAQCSAVPGDSSSEMARFVELKTSREVENQRQRNTLQRFKMLKWWAQSFLVGIERVVVGFRDDHGTVHQIRCYGTRDLPRQQTFWSPSVCMNFTSAFLGYVNCHVTGDDPRAVWRFDFEPQHGRVASRRLGGEEADKFRVLPDWYVQKMFSDDMSGGD